MLRDDEKGEAGAIWPEVDGYTGYGFGTCHACSSGEHTCFLLEHDTEQDAYKTSRVHRESIKAQHTTLADAATVVAM